MIIGKEEWAELLRAHALWLVNDYAGERARLAGQDLRAMALRETQLSGADMRNTRLDGLEAWSAVRASSVAHYTIYMPVDDSALASILWQTTELAAELLVKPGHTRAGSDSF